MHTAKHLLQMLTIAFPPFVGAKHALTVHEGELCLIIAFAQDDWRHIRIEGESLDRPVNELVEDIAGILAAVAFDAAKEKA